MRLLLPLLFPLACSADRASPLRALTPMETTGVDTGTPAAEADPEAPAAEDSAAPQDTGPTEPPITIMGLDIEAVPDCVVCATVVVQLDQPAPVTILVGKEGESIAPWVYSAEATEHRIPLLELHGDTNYRIEASIIDDHGERREDTTFRTLPLPNIFPPIELTTGGDIRQQPGLTLINVLEWANPDGRRFFVLAVDEDGQIVWYHQLDRMALALAIDEQRRIYTTDSVLKAVRIDPYGQQKTVWTAEDLGVDAVHHELRPTPDGGMAFIGTELEVVDGWDIIHPIDTSRLNVVADRFLTVDAAGDETWSWNMLDHFDPTEHFTSDLHMNFWDMPPYLGVEDPKDWSHANSLVPNGDNWLVSLRNLDWLMQVNPRTNNVDWIFGPEGDFSLAEGGRWFSRQHRPSITDEGNILLYDNGLDRVDARPGDLPFTRVVEYALDHENMRATERWSWSGHAPYFCPIAGGIQQLENGNYFINDGAIHGGIHAAEDRPMPHYSARLREIVGTKDPEIIWELTIGTPGEFDKASWYVYRTQRIDSLYPHWARPE